MWLGSLRTKERHNTRNFLKQISADNVASAAAINSSENTANSGLYVFSVHRGDSVLVTVIENVRMSDSNGRDCRRLNT